MAVFRVEKSRGYTVMSNHHLRNKELSLKAKGLLSQMLSLPEDWTFTLDPISKRRLDNFGEEDQFYIRDHHEAIISEEMFEKAQEILKRRAKPRRLGTDGKREKFSRKYAEKPIKSCWLFIVGMQKLNPAKSRIFLISAANPKRSSGSF